MYVRMYDHIVNIYIWGGVNIFKLYSFQICNRIDLCNIKKSVIDCINIKIFFQLFCSLFTNNGSLLKVCYIGIRKYYCFGCAMLFTNSVVGLFEHHYSVFNPLCICISIQYSLILLFFNFLSR